MTKFCSNTLFFLWVLSLSGADTQPTVPGKITTVDPETVLTAVSTRLMQEFDQLLEQPAEFEKKVKDECRSFPEQDLFPYTFPALAYANLAMSSRIPHATALARMEILINLLLPNLALKLDLPEQAWNRLDTYRDHATWIGNANWVLSIYRKLGGTKFGEINDRLSAILLKAILENKGEPLHSYPDLTWQFDTMPCLISLVLWKPDNPMVNQAVQMHLEWLKQKGMNPQYHLPSSLVNGTSVPRGCDLSLRIPYLSVIDPEFASNLYVDYRRQFWRGFIGLSGFAEWPSGYVGTPDIDSGPVYFGIGMAATGNGISTAIAMNDPVVSAALCQQLAMRDPTVTFILQNPTFKKEADEMFSTMGISFNPVYFTGFLYGDAVIFFTTTWPPPAVRKK